MTAVVTPAHVSLPTWEALGLTCSIPRNLPTSFRGSILASVSGEKREVPSASKQQQQGEGWARAR